MKLSELMKNVKPDASFSGIITADDFVLAIGFGEAKAVGDYLVAQGGITEQSGSLEAVTSESTDLRSGTTETKTGTKRTFTVAGDRMVGDELQDALLDHDIKYGTGQTVVKPYVYFCMLTGKGEKGYLSIKIEDDPSGEVGGNAGFTAALAASGTPQKYTWAAEQPLSKAVANK